MNRDLGRALEHLQNGDWQAAHAIVKAGRPFPDEPVIRRELEQLTKAASTSA